MLNDEITRPSALTEHADWSVRDASLLFNPLTGSDWD